MNLVEKLLALDTGKLVLPEKEIEMKRLSGIFGEKAVFKCKAIDSERYSDIQKMAIDMSKKGDIKNINMYDMQVMTVIEGVVEPNLKDKQLLEHFGCVTPKDLVKKLLLAGEITDLFNTINTLCGYDAESSDIKN